MLTIADNAALVVIDVQHGFDDDYWGPTTNPACKDNIDALLFRWNADARPIVAVRHDSSEPSSPLHPSHPGNALLNAVEDAGADLLVTKNVNSAFLGDPGLHIWLAERGIGQLVLCGIQTNMCVETTARMGGNLGYNVVVALDATRTFDLSSKGEAPMTATADELMRTTAINLSGGGFATVASTTEVLGVL